MFKALTLDCPAILFLFFLDAQCRLKLQFNQFLHVLINIAYKDLVEMHLPLCCRSLPVRLWRSWYLGSCLCRWICSASTYLPWLLSTEPRLLILIRASRCSRSILWLACECLGRLPYLRKVKLFVAQFLSTGRWWAIWRILNHTFFCID